MQEMGIEIKLAVFFCFCFLFLHGPNVDGDSCRVGAELIGQFEGVGSRIVLLHARDGEGGELTGVLYMVAIILPARQRLSRVQPLDAWFGVS